MQSASLDESQGGIKIARRNVSNLRYADDTTQMAKNEEPLDDSERGSEKAGIELNIQKAEIIAYSPITSWQIEGETMEAVTDFILGGSKITADGGKLKITLIWSYQKLQKMKLFQLSHI